MKAASIIQYSFIIFASCASTITFAERFLNVSSKKIKVSVVDIDQNHEKKVFVLAPMSHKLIDLSKLWKDKGVYITVKPMRASYLAEKKLDKADKCEQCSQTIEMRCGCQNKQVKKDKKEVDVDLHVTAKEMHVQNEFIIVGTQEGLKLKLFGLKNQDANE